MSYFEYFLIQNVEKIFAKMNNREFFNRPFKKKQYVPDVAARKKIEN